MKLEVGPKEPFKTKKIQNQLCIMESQVNAQGQISGMGFSRRSAKFTAYSTEKWKS